MRRLVSITGALAATALVTAVVACGSSVADSLSEPSVDLDAGDAATVDSAPPPVPTFSVGGSVTGLAGTGLVLQNNAGDDIPVASNGSFTFPTKLAAGAAFTITVKTQPSAPTQTCIVSGGTGTIASGNVTAVTVNCASDKFTVGGMVSGLVGSGLVLQNNAGDDVIVNADGTFAFPTAITSGANYAVTVKSQPSEPTQTCTVVSGSGKVGAANITNVAVTCATNKHKVGGTVVGLVGSGLTLEMNGGQSLPVSGDTFEFPTAIPSGSTFEVTVSAQPGSPQQTCIVSGGTGTIGSTDESSVLVNCTTDAHAIGGSVTGLVGKGLVLQNNGGNDYSVSASGTFAFSKPVKSGQTYDVTVATQPSNPWQTCTMANAVGTVGNADVSDIAVTCTTDKYKIKASVTGLAGSGLVLQNNAGDSLPISENGTFEFALPIASGATFNITVKDQPSALSQSCTVSNGTGTVAGSDVGDVVVSCTTNKFTVGGAVSGLVGSGLVIQNNAGDNYAVSKDGPFTFPSSVLSGGAYAVSVLSQPTNPSQTCVVNAGSGTITNGNVVGVVINCSTNKYAVGVKVNGLAGKGLVLQNNGGDDLTVNNSGTFAFNTTITSGASYSVSVKTQPTVPTQTCVVENASGTVGGAEVSNISVTCTTTKFKVGGTLSGLASGTVILQNNGGDNLSLNSNAAFTFVTPVDSGATYNVTVFSQPAGQTCVVTNGNSSVGAADVTNVVVQCRANKLVFVTSTKYNGNLGGLAGADAKCQARADAANLGGTYKAWLSDNTGSPSTRFTQSTSAYVRIDGTKVANNWADLTDGTLLASISVTELKTPGPTTNYCGANEITVWTNTTGNGLQNNPSASCGNWSGAGGGTTSWGLGGLTDSGFTAWCQSLNGSSWCSNTDPASQAALYCFQQ